MVSQETIKLSDKAANALFVEPLVIKQLGIQTVPALVSNSPIVINLPGSLSLDSTRLENVRSRFDGEIMEIGKIADGSRPLQFGDAVKPGQLLAVVWSRELGEKKSELVDALSQLGFDTATRDRLTGLAKLGAIPERELKEVERAIESDLVAVSRARRTLQIWRISPEEFAEVEAEAKRLIDSTQEAPSEIAEQWARVEVKAANEGIILEHNVAVGDIVNSSDVLFKLGGLTRLRVIAAAYEEYLPLLDAMSPSERTWSISVPADPSLAPIKGAIEQIGQIIDPTQHTAVVMGWVPNPQGTLRAGQFISAQVEFAPPGNEVLLPNAAVIESGGKNFVFVIQEAASEEKPALIVRRSVIVSRQLRDRVCILIDPTKTTSRIDSMDATAEGLNPGESVVSSGAVELQQAFVDLTAEKP